jgi:hypothetical protein
MLCVTLPATAKSDCGFVGSKHKINAKQKIHMTEILKAGCDHVMAK